MEYIVAWQPPAEVFQRYPNLQVVFSIGAGVDQFDLESFPDHVKLVRMLDPGILQGMLEYATLGVLALHRDLPQYRTQQQNGLWRALPTAPARDREVGIMGLGNLGRALAARLLEIGFPVRGWSRSGSDLPGIRSFAGEEEFSRFLGGSDILVCLLPLTPATRGILDSAALARLPRGARLLNVGRGAHVDEEALLAALDSGQLAGAMLDVLSEEPPPDDHPFWKHPRILLTPHIAASTQYDSGCDALLENIRRHRSGLPMAGEVNRSTGY